MFIGCEVRELMGQLGRRFQELNQGGHHLQPGHALLAGADPGGERSGHHRRD